MRFKESKKIIMCIRTTYDIDKKRGVDKTIVSIDKYLTKVPQEAIDELEAEEVEQLQALLDARQKSHATLSASLAIRFLPTHLNEAIKALGDESQRAQVTAETAEKIWAALDDMRRAMRKAGFAKPKARGGDEG
jgi:hypothetical protein